MRSKRRWLYFLPGGRVTSKPPPVDPASPLYFPIEGMTMTLHSEMGGPPILVEGKVCSFVMRDGKWEPVIHRGDAK